MHAPGVRGDRPAGLGQRDRCAGRFDPALFDTPDGKLIARHVGRDTVIRVLDAHFATSTEQFRAEDQKAAARAGVDDQLRRFTYNPLRGHPLLTGFGAGYLCPMPQLAWAKATPWGVYFTGLGHYGDRFARDLGHLFEQYIGRQLRLLPDAQVLPEITYGPRTARRKTVDWIVVLPEVVLLVEVKSAIPTEPVRLGTPDAADAMLSKLGKAFTPDRRHRAAHRGPGPGARGRARGPASPRPGGHAGAFPRGQRAVQPAARRPHAGHRSGRGRDRGHGHDHRHVAGQAPA